MRKIVAQMFLSLDGVMEAPEQWQFPYHDDQMAQVIAAHFHESDALLLGRATYEIFAPHHTPMAQLHTDPRRRRRRTHHTQKGARKQHHHQRQLDPRPITLPHQRP